MKMDAGKLNRGNVIEFEGAQYSILKTYTIKPGKGGAYIQVEMRNVLTGLKKETRFRTSESVEKLMNETKPCQFLFSDGDSLTFMDNSTYEQFNLPKEVLGDSLPLLEDGMNVHIQFISGILIGFELPNSFVCEIAETEGVVKGQTAASSNKPATLTNGLRVMIPVFINAGEKIVINTEDLSYIERSK